MHYNRDTGLFEEETNPRRKKSTIHRMLVADNVIEAVFIVVEKGLDVIGNAVKKLFNFVSVQLANHSNVGNGGGDEPPSENNSREKFNMNFPKKTIMYGVGAIASIIMLFGMIGINDAGHRTVVQHLDGELVVVFDSGPYLQAFGKTTTYNDVITFDFDKAENEEGATIDQAGIPVRYQDGGTGHVYGIARMKLPSLEEEMLRIHKDFRSNDGIAYKTIKPVTEEIANHTAGLMTSEESYAEKRGLFTQYIKDQLRNGKYGTVQDKVVTVEAGLEYCLEKDLTPALKKECRDVKKTTKNIPVIATKDGIAVTNATDIQQYKIALVGFTQSDWGYEDKTLKQISDKREATMAIITSKANAERAKQDAITAKQQGLANVETAKYEKEVEKIKAVVDAEKAKEVAVVKAEQLVDVAEQNKLAEIQNKLAAKETKQKEILLGQGEAERKRLNMQADGALHPKLDAWKEVNFRYADNIGKQKWVSEITMGAGEGSSGTGAAQLIDMFAAKTAKELSLDMTMKGKK
jgi:hypothetical protein